MVSRFDSGTESPLSRNPPPSETMTTQTVTAANPVESRAAIASLNIGAVVRFPGEQSLYLYKVTGIDADDNGGVSALLQRLGNVPREYAQRAELVANAHGTAGAAGFRFQLKTLTGDRQGRAVVFPGFQVVA